MEACSWLTFGVDATRLLSKHADPTACTQAEETAKLADALACKAREVADLVYASVHEA